MGGDASIVQFPSTSTAADLELCVKLAKPPRCPERRVAGAGRPPAELHDHHFDEIVQPPKVLAVTGVEGKLRRKRRGNDEQVHSSFTASLPSRRITEEKTLP